MSQAQPTFWRKRKKSNNKDTKQNKNQRYDENINNSLTFWLERREPEYLLRNGRKKKFTVSVAIPGSLIKNCHTLELKTILIGQIARSLSLFEVDEVIIFVDTGSEQASDLEKGPSAFCYHLLQYIEAPPYLRKKLFPMHPDLKFAGLLPSLDSPHHLRRDDISLYREGIVTSRPAQEGKSYVDVGLQSEVLINHQLRPGIRVTVKLNYEPPDEHGNRPQPTEGIAVSPREPTEKYGLYWGFQIRFARSFGEVFTGCPFVNDNQNDNTTTTNSTSSSSSTTTTPISCKGKIFLTSGLGGMSGAQPKAATINGAICIIAEVDSSALIKRHEQGWLDEYYTTPEDVINRAKIAQENNESVSIGYLGNVVELWEYLANTPVEKRCKISVGSDQTSLHNPYNGGYYPVGLTFEESQYLMSNNPIEFKKKVQESLHRHLNAITKLKETDNMLFFDYGNAFLLECHRAGCEVDPTIPSYVECIMGPEFFDYGFGPYRWVCTSGNINELQITDNIATKVLQDQMNDSTNNNILPQLQANLDWITRAMENNLVVGSKARILYSDLEGRIECAVRMNRAIASGEIKSPIVIGRDHHDVSGTDSPWRETSNIKDGSNLTADMSVQNVIGDAMRGATWVSLHNGGGTGWGVASNGGFGLVLDGTERAERRARDMIFFDVANGLTRRARAGNPHAMETIQRLAKKYPNYQPFLPSIENE